MPGSVGPPPTQSVEADTRVVVHQLKEKNRLWILARLSAPENQTVSSWTGFNILIRDEVTVVQDSVGYLPTINSPAPQLSTVYEVLNQSFSIMQSLELSELVCVFDQALYAKAAEVIWKHQDKFKDIIIRMGGCLPHDWHAAINPWKEIRRRRTERSLCKGRHN